ncbi:MAG: preprotein translocase subunit SecE [Treponema sp.]|nr:preprotein translocase subunit SecE [Treponema sp.]
MAKMFQYFKECKAELKKVVWPSKTDVFASLKVVIISTIIVAVLLGLLDFGFTEAFRALMK